MAASHGSKAVFKTGTFAAPTTVQDMSQYGNSVGLTLNRDASEVTTFALQSKKYIAGLKDATVPFEGPFDDACDLIMWDLYNNGTIVNFEYFPAGTTAGKPKYSGTLFVTSYEVSSDVSDANATSGEFQITGDVARGVAP
jgi:hypothetical protein